MHLLSIRHRKRLVKVVNRGQPSGRKADASTVGRRIPTSREMKVSLICKRDHQRADPRE
ncbi:hypothetical protein X777_14552 [Ooceraea biroi]|uniref:Uncharacterized protein n=1 Tax=Ooceraea biroi TaxID=2015173 RepID=A0A026WXQ8_OOCBI|nr:hypothetical protein X777_14552 [Ooceraea biroi]